jgi:RimJ/RimL family protein N-acetyltransferase
MITPHPIILEGHGVRLEPLERGHAAALAAAANDGELWKLWYVAVSGLAPGNEGAYVEAALDGLRAGHTVPWIVRELSTGSIVGSTRYHDIVHAIDRVEIGFTFYAATWQRTHVNTATKLLLLEHAFDTLGCQVVGFRADGLNVKSQQALEALGAKKDGALRHFQSRTDGSARDVHFFSILASEWPAVKKRLEERLERHRR